MAGLIIPKKMRTKNNTTNVLQFITAIVIIKIMIALLIWNANHPY